MSAARHAPFLRIWRKGAPRRVDALSEGMQRRLLIARALVADPELVVLDEPTTALWLVGFSVLLFPPAVNLFRRRLIV